jgi:uncharacterized protein (DUF983 family)
LKAKNINVKPVAILNDTVGTLLVAMSIVIRQQILAPLWGQVIIHVIWKITTLLMVKR